MPRKKRKKLKNFLKNKGKEESFVEIIIVDFYLK